VALTLAGVFPAPAQTSPEAETARICAEAAERYRTLFDAAPEAADPPVVLMYNYRFCPADFAARRGARVRFVNVDKRTSHSVWLRAAGRPESERVFSGDHVEVTLDDLSAGEHEVLCGPHWEREGMVGRLTVTD